MPRKKVLFVTTDLMPGRIGARIARAMDERYRYDVVIVAHGRSVEEWESYGFQITYAGPDDANEPFDIDPAETVRKENPDIIVTGLSSPMRIEESFAFSARARHCKIVYMEDDWGGISRSKIAADLVLTIDRIAEMIYRLHPIYKKLSSDTHRCRIIGDLVATAIAEEIPSATRVAFEKAKGNAGRAILLALPKRSEGRDVVEITLRSIALTSRRDTVVVIPRFHPSTKDEDRAIWVTMISIMGDAMPGSVQLVDLKHKTEHLAMLTDGTFAAAGSALRAAAYAGKMPICVCTETLLSRLKYDYGGRHHPLVTVGIGLEVSRPTSLYKLEYIHNSAQNLAKRKELLSPLPFNAEAAADAIRALSR